MRRTALAIIVFALGLHAAAETPIPIKILRSTVSPNHRTVTVVAQDQETHRTVELACNVGSPECNTLRAGLTLEMQTFPGGYYAGTNVAVWDPENPYPETSRGHGVYFLAASH
jgi:hypothetical protein